MRKIRKISRTVEGLFNPDCSESLNVELLSVSFFLTVFATLWLISEYVKK